MKNKLLYQTKLKKILFITIISFICGSLFTYIVDGPFIPLIIRGGSVGLMIGFLLSTLEIFLSDGLYKRFNMLQSVILKSSIYSIVITSILTINAYYGHSSNLLPNQSFLDTLQHPNFKISIYFSFAISLILIFTISINDLIGRGILFKFLIGSYHKPKEENKIFMFLDLKDSTSIAERLGHIKYLSLIRDFFYDMSSPVLRTKGEIYKYVGDEAIVTWDYKKGLKKLNSILCFFTFREIINNKRDYYLKKYGLVPDFKAAIHGGSVVTGEIGTIKKEITYLGDIVNTTSRIEGLCKELKEDLLISGELLGEFKDLKEFKTTEYKDIKLRGKQEMMTVFSINKKTPVIIINS